MNVLLKAQSRFVGNKSEELTLEEYLNLCKKDASAHATPFERMLKAIGEPELIDTSTDPRLGRIFSNRIIRRYSAFKDFYGIEETIERLVDFFKHAAQGLEESKQILYLLGPVGGSKSTLAERLKTLMENQPFYAIKDSPLNESPLCLFDAISDGDDLESTYSIPRHKLTYKPSPWLVKQIEKHDGDLSFIRIVKKYPSKNKQIAIARTEPGDENNQDISCLVGKIDIRKLEFMSPNDPEAYSYSGGLCLSNRGVLEFVEMFKAPIKVLHPLLSATQDRQYNGTESIASLPFEGVILAHSNEAEWESFRNDKKNEAFIDRVYIVKVPYCLRVDEEVQIYEKLIKNSNLANSPCAPRTLEMLAQFSVTSRLKIDRSSDNVFTKMRVYNGENVKDKVNNPKSFQTYRNEAGPNEGMGGISSRFAFKILSKTFNFDTTELSANPIHLMEVLRTRIEQEQFSKEFTDALNCVLKDYIEPDYFQYLSRELAEAYVESYEDYGQNIFDKYVMYAEAFSDDKEFRDPNTGIILDRASLDKHLSEIERPAGIANSSDFRSEVVMFVLRARNLNKGKNPKWTDFQKMKTVIQKKILLNVDELLPVIAFDVKRTGEDERKHKSFVTQMKNKGYTEKQIKLVTQYFIERHHRQK